MVTKQRKIKVSTANLRNLAELHGCTETAVYNALGYRSNSANAENIRQSALSNFGGKEVTEIIMRWLMKMTDEQMRQMAEEIALSYEQSGEATIEADGGVFQAEYRKGADIVCDETYYCTVSGAWCNINSLLYYSDDDLYKGEKVECDIEVIENIVCEMTNN